MGLFSGLTLNPFTLGRKHRAAWNALMGAYTFYKLPAAFQHVVLGRVEDLIEDQFHQTLDEFLRKHSRIVFFNLLVYGMGEEGIDPALGDEKWFWIKNPIVECIGAEDAIEMQRQQLKQKYQVEFDIER